MTYIADYILGTRCYYLIKNVSSPFEASPFLLLSLPRLSKRVKNDRIVQLYQNQNQKEGKIKLI